MALVRLATKEEVLPGPVALQIMVEDRRTDITLEEIERHSILSTLEACGGRTAQAAQMLDISVRKIQYKLHEYGISLQRTATPAGKPGEG